MLLIVLACRNDAQVIDTGGRSLDAPVPSTGTAATAGGDSRNIDVNPRREKRDPTRLLLRSGSLGPYLTDGAGQALYTFSGDERGQPACLTSCAGAWPPVAVDRLPREIDRAIDASLLKLVDRPDGTRQLVLAGRPLYYSESDIKPGDTWGHYAMGFGGRFTLVSPAGQPLPAPR
jgi:predicted lipoprotein with Yx(FWY)xxD motif